MKLSLKHFFWFSLIVNLVLAYRVFKPDNFDRTPPWHPFELNSELDLESIVENGYRFASMPCGQVQYVKKVGDTVIQYEVELEYHNFFGQFIHSVYPKGINIETNPNSKNQHSTFKLETAQNKYYPWNSYELMVCPQNIDWRVFTIFLGNTIDSTFIRDYVSLKGGYIIESTENWNTQNGGSFMVSHSDSHLYFYCSLVKDYQEDSEPNNWRFEIIRDIPHLNQKLILKEKEKQKMKEEYYDDFEDVVLEE